jgi:heme/copper-type cytochrome/quinol oxidase subunit 1
MRITSRMLGVFAALLIVLGAVVVATAPAESFGWFAYAPLTDDVYTHPGRISLPAVLGGRQLLGLVAVVAGLVLAGSVAGFRLGRRHSR